MPYKKQLWHVVAFDVKPWNDTKLKSQGYRGSVMIFTILVFVNAKKSSVRGRSQIVSREARWFSRFPLLPPPTHTPKGVTLIVTHFQCILDSWHTGALRFRPLTHGRDTILVSVYVKKSSSTHNNNYALFQQKQTCGKGILRQEFLPKNYRFLFS